MSRRPASIRQSDMSRAIRAAKAAGLRAVEFTMPGGGTIRLPLTDEPNVSPLSPQSKVSRRKDIVL